MVSRKLEPLSRVFSSEEQVREITERFGTPVYVYSQGLLEEQARKALAFPNAFGLTVRYAMKASPNANLLRIFYKQGIQIDASSKDEVYRAIRAGIPPESILLTSQIAPKNLRALIDLGVNYNACSLTQLHKFVEAATGGRVSIRVNPGLGSGGTNRTNTGGESSSFGIWHEQLEEAFRIAKSGGLLVNRVHTHIGSGSDPQIWKKVSLMSLEIVRRFLERGFPISILNLGGGYKIRRMLEDKEADMQEIGSYVKRNFQEFREETGVSLHLEIEPGTFLVANAGAVIARIEDIKTTPGYKFLITDSGMNEVPRPTMYAAQHPIAVIPRAPENDENAKTDLYIVSGRCCESGDILTPSKKSPERLKPRRLAEAKEGDLIVIGGSGAYCSGMAFKHYNSYPEAPEVLIGLDGKPLLIRARGTLEQITQNEIEVIR